jgi:hypothetical protein
MLDAPNDRRAAQALIDFWVSKTNSMGSGRLSKRPLFRRTGIQLEPFDPTVVEAAIKKGDAALISLSDKENNDKNMLNRVLRSGSRYFGYARHSVLGSVGRYVYERVRDFFV